MLRFTWLKVFSNRSFSAARRLLGASGGHCKHPRDIYFKRWAMLYDFLQFKHGNSNIKVRLNTNSPLLFSAMQQGNKPVSSSALIMWKAITSYQSTDTQICVCLCVSGLFETFRDFSDKTQVEIHLLMPLRNGKWGNTVIKWAIRIKKKDKNTISIKYH